MKKYFILSFIILAALSLSACGSGAVENDRNLGAVDTENTEPSGDSVAAGNSMNVESCIGNCSIIEADTGLVSKETCRIGCYMEEAKIKKNPEICISNVQDSLMLAACLTAVAEETKDATVCDKIGADEKDFMRGACYINLTEKTGDTSVCENIKNSIFYTDCTGTADEQK